MLLKCNGGVGIRETFQMGEVGKDKSVACPEGVLNPMGKILLDLKA